jgi:MFS transporter, DHA2 family, multidrug resistance protein
MAVAVVTGLLVDALGSTLLSFARAEVSGFFGLGPDDYAALIVTYTAAKIAGFLLAPWCVGLRGARGAYSAALGVQLCAFALMTLTGQGLIFLVLCGVIGLAGGILLVAAQTLLFQTFARRRQPVVQLAYALGSAAGAAALAPGFQGWALDWLDWRWIACAAIATGILALALLTGTDTTGETPSRRSPGDMRFVLLAGSGVICLAYVSTQGERWNWFDSPHILWASIAGAAAILLTLRILLRQPVPQRMIDTSVFGNLNFSFAFLASFAAGFALFGTGYLIPAYAAGGLGMNSAQIGQLLLPGWLCFAGAMGITAFLLPRLRVPPVITVPLGILLIMVAMWMFAGQAKGASVATLMPAVLLRGAALGFLFLAITLMALMDLPDQVMAHGAALLSAARQLGGLAGTGYLGSLLSRQTEVNAQILSAQLNSGNPVLLARIAGLTARFEQSGHTPTEAASLAMGTLARALTGQANAIAWNNAFTAVVVFFMIAAPVLVLSRTVLARMISASRT